MPGSHPVRWFLLLCAALAAFGCANTDTDQGASGSLSLNLVLAGDIQIDVVDWEITGNGMDMGGSVDVSAPGSTASIEVYGLPVGEEPYVVELSAVSVDKEVTCRGSAEFDIEVGVSTPVMVILSCKVPQQLGSVRVNGKLNICAQLTKMVVAPLQTSVGNDIGLFSAASDEEGDPIAYMWSSDSGSIADPVAASTTYTCTEVGDDDITVLVTDDDGTYCMSMWTVRVTCVAGEGNPCDGVICEDDGNECTSEACNPSSGACESSPVDDGTSCADATGVCMDGECVPNDLCVDVICEDDGNECTDEACNPANGQCETSNNANPCDGGNGTCNAGVCEPNAECAVDADCPSTGNECIDSVCNAGTCETSNNSNACDGGNGTCSAGVCEPNDLCMDVVCEDDGNECTDEACNPTNGQCETSNNTNACDGGAGTCNAGTCEPNAEVVYEQTFETLDGNSATALSDDGWLFFANVFNAAGTFLFPYGPFGAPNGTTNPSGVFISAVASGEGDAPQGAQQLSVFSDYNCCQPSSGHINGTDRVEISVFQEPRPAGSPISAADIGQTLEFSFDAKRGNIEGATTALAYIQTLNPAAGFNRTNFVTIDMTNLPAGAWNRYTIMLDLTDPLLIGQILQVGFQNTAQNFEGSGNFYDNVLVTTAPTP